MAELLEAEALAALEDAEADSIAEALDTAALAIERPLGPPAGKAAAKKAAAKKAPARHGTVGRPPPGRPANRRTVVNRPRRRRPEARRRPAWITDLPRD